MSITNKGAIFSFDLLFSFIFFLLILFLGIWELSYISENHIEWQKKTGLETEAIFLADSLVKNFDENSLIGIAVFDEEKLRVKSNEISEEKIVLLEKNERIAEAWIREKNSSKKIFFSKENSGNFCIAVERFVFVNEKKALLGVRVCE